jgi:oligoendopeptidase F
MSKNIITGFLLFSSCYFTQAQQSFKPVPDSLNALYKYDLQKNFFKTEQDFNSFLTGFNFRLSAFANLLNKTNSSQNLERLTQQLSELEYDFRKMDLYLFLQYATNTKNIKASLLEDSVYDAIAAQRNRYKNHIKTASSKSIKELIAAPFMKPYQYYINNIIDGKSHELSPAEISITKPFNYLKNNRYYDELVNTIPTDTIYTITDTLDLFNDMGAWQNHPDSAVRTDGERKLYESFSTVATPLAYRYIQMIKGLNAFSVAKKYENLIQENCYKLSLSEKTLQVIFKEIEANALLFKEFKKRKIDEISRYSITKSTEILLNSFQQLGSDYYTKAAQLLNPGNGRLDIVGGPNRIGLQGAASVYPIDVSTFYANNYGGYYIDIMLLAHESGHAVQASLMYDNKVSLLNSSGPGYFTESFGKFNELLVSYYLYQNSKDAEQRKFYGAKYIERLLGLFGSAQEAAIEYNLIQGILADKLTGPSDIDSSTFATESKYSDYSKFPEQKGLWMRLETNFKAPMHNINDMLASLLAIHYFRQFLFDKNNFSIKYNKFLKNGYTDSPPQLLINFMKIEISDKRFCTDAIKFIHAELIKIKTPT